MGIEINLNNLNISGNSEVMQNVKIANGQDVHIGLQHAAIQDNAKVLNDLEITPLLDELMRKAQIMDKNSPEYPKIKKILGVKKWNKADLTKCILHHIGEFSQGVLASIVAAHFFKQLISSPRPAHSSPPSPAGS